MSDDPHRPSAPEPMARMLWALTAVTLFLMASGVILGRVELGSIGLIPVTGENMIYSAVYLGFIGALVGMLQGPVIRRRMPRRDQPICGHCFTPYVEGAHFCPTCSAPQTFFAATGSYEQVYAQAWILGKAARHPTSSWHVVWLTALAVSAMLPVLFVFRFQSDYGPVRALDAVAHTLIAAEWCVWAAVYVALALRCWRSWLGRDTRPAESTYGSAPWWTHDAHARVPVAGDADV